jgi:hypothetical protein
VISASRFRKPRPRGAIVAGVVVVAVGVGFAVADARGGDDDNNESPSTTVERELERDGSAVATDGAPVVIGDEPVAYTITYRVTERSSTATTEEVVVRRPFASETTVRRDGEVIGVTRSAFGRLIVDDQVFAVGPSLAGPDLRLRPALDDALARRLLDAREQRVVAGRRCQVYRAGASVVGGLLQPPPDPRTEYADACFDADGLLLEEWWVVDGDAIRHRVATEVTLDAPADLGREWESRATTLDLEHGGGSLLRLAEGSMPPGTFFLAATVPDGFEHVGRYSVIPPQGAAFGDAAQRGSIVASTADVWQRGPDLLVVDQGGSLEQRTVYERDPDHPIEAVPGVGDFEVILGLAGNEVRLLRDGGRFVRVLGTLSADELLGVASGLSAVEGNELVIDEG